jgi:tRNA 2-thiouridine synthesizing protein A
VDGVLIDTRGLSCPLPVLKVRKTMRNVAAGTEASVLATDPLAEHDIRVYCEVSACDFLLAETLAGGVIRLVIRKR